MGITGLLPFIKGDVSELSAIKPSHLSQFRGQKAAVDAYSWIHKGVYSCSYELFMGQATDKYVVFCTKYIKLLQSFDITPVLVFDGARMPFKVVEKKRKEDRKNARKEANDFLAVGNHEEARKQIVKAIDVTTEMAWNVMEAARMMGVECIVAPYEADAQLAYLSQANYVDVVITEDSDLIIFGCKKILFKLNNAGHVNYFNEAWLENALRLKSVRFRKFSFSKFRHAAILSGCDYAKNLPGVGLVKAWKFMNMTENTNPRQFLKKIPAYLKMELQVEDEYIQSFLMADLAFKYQLAFDPIKKKRVPLNDPEDEGQDYQDFLSAFGLVLQDEYQLALGNVDTRDKIYGSYDPMATSFKSIFKVFGSEVKCSTPAASGGAFGTDQKYENVNKRRLEDVKIVPYPEETSDSDLCNMYLKEPKAKRPKRPSPPPADCEKLVSGFFASKPGLLIEEDSCSESLDLKVEESEEEAEMSPLVVLQDITNTEEIKDEKPPPEIVMETVKEIPPKKVSKETQTKKRPKTTCNRATQMPGQNQPTLYKYFNKL